MLDYQKEITKIVSDPKIVREFKDFLKECSDGSDEDNEKMLSDLADGSKWELQWKEHSEYCEELLDGDFSDVAGSFDNELASKFMSAADKCYHTVFVPPHLYDNYRIEFLITPDEDQVIGWSLIVD